MKTLRPLHSGLLAVVLLGAGWIGARAPLTFNLVPESTLTVSGTSTLHDWHCSVPEFTGTIVADPEAKNAASAVEALTNVSVVVPAAKLDCGNGKMNDKALDALEVEANPTIRYQMDSATVIGNDGDAVLMTAKGTLTIAGTERPIEMKVRGEKTAAGAYRFTGEVPVRMTDYDMKPPTAVFGTIKTGDDVTVHFDVTAK